MQYALLHDNKVHSTIRACTSFKMAYFCGHVMPWELCGISNLISTELYCRLLSSFVFLGPRDDVSAVAPLSHTTSQSECMRRVADLLYIVLMKNPLEDSFSKLTHTQGLKGFSWIACGFKSVISCRLLDCHWHGLDPRVLRARSDLSLLRCSKRMTWVAIFLLRVAHIWNV